MDGCHGDRAEAAVVAGADHQLVAFLDGAADDGAAGDGAHRRDVVDLVDLTTTAAAHNVGIF